MRKTVSRGDPVLCVVFAPPETVPPPVTRRDLAYLMIPVLFHDPRTPETVPNFNDKEPLKGLVKKKIDCLYSSYFVSGDNRFLMVSTIGRFDE